MACKKIDTWKGEYTTPDRTKLSIKLVNVSYVLDLTTNLLSLTQTINNGWDMIGIRESLMIEKRDCKIEFNKKTTSRSGCV